MAADEVLGALTAASPAARAAGEADAVAGVTPRYVASPASTEEASALLRVAAERDLAVVPRGSGSKLGWGARPRRCDLVIDTSLLSRVVEHAAGDLVARVQAGVRLEALAQTLAGSGQQLSLDGMTGTVGGALATGVAGPRRLRYGSPRDLVIGITVVRADGTIAHSGGKVVKNVAGYDLGKLFAGSYGTLGLITEAVFRLHPLPAAVSYVTVECGDAAGARAAVAAAAGSDLAPTAVEVDRAGRGEPVRVGVLLEGDPQGVSERSGQMSRLLGPGAQASPAAPAWWGLPAAPGTSGEAATPGAPGDSGTAGTLIRIGFWAAGLPKIFAVIDAAATGAGLDPAVSGSAAAGVLYAYLGPGASPAAVAAFVSALRAALSLGEGDARPAAATPGEAPGTLASALVLHAPPAVADLVDLWGPVPSLALMRAVKDQFDPGHLMAPGRFVGGI